MRRVLLLGTTVLMLGACQEVDYYDPNYRKNVYDFSWKNTFGEVDPDQDWNMAAGVKAVIDLSREGVNNATIQILSSRPTKDDPGSLLALTRLSGGEGTINFNTVQGTAVVYVVVTDDSNHVLYRSYCPVQADGTVLIGSAAVTRATRAASSVSLGERCYSAKRVSNAVDETYTIDDARSVDDTHFWQLDRVVDGTYYFYNINGETKECNQWQLPGQYGCYSPTDDCSSLYPYRLIAGTYQKLNGVESYSNNSWVVSDYYPVFGKGGYMAERAYPHNLERWKNSFDTDIDFVVSGQVTLDYIFGGSGRESALGYYYWRDGEDPMKATRYVLLYDTKPTSCLTLAIPEYVTEWNQEASRIDTLAISGYTSRKPYSCDEVSYWLEQYCNKDVIVTGTSYNIPYFGADGVPTYTFPEGTHMAFFLVPDHNSKSFDQWLPSAEMSLQSHNHAIARNQSGTTEGMIDAVAFRYNKQIFIGFEDNTGYDDDDMNDVVFFLNGNVRLNNDRQADEVPAVINFDFDDDEDEDTPSGGDDDINTSEEIHPEPMTWIIACEDMGSIGDFDFNDVVFAVTYASGETTATITPLAAGGFFETFITYNGEPLGETHYMLGAIDRNKLINTGATELEGGSVGTGKPVTIDVPADWNIADRMGGLGIKVRNSGTNQNATDVYEIAAPEQGSAPQMILVPGHWRWPMEKQRITSAYPDFSKWCSDKSTATWYNNVDEMYVFKR